LGDSNASILSRTHSGYRFGTTRSTGYIAGRCSNTCKTRKKLLPKLFRVMKPGAVGFIGTPFMQPFHGYPCHYQNFTHAGHQRLFERAGFRVLEWGVSSGPAWTMAGIVLAFISTYFPAPLRWPALALWLPIGLFLICPLDRWLVNSDKAYVLASDTYVLIAKSRAECRAAPSPAVSNGHVVVALDLEASASKASASPQQLMAGLSGCVRD
jgi:hypothetical protein